MDISKQEPVYIRLDTKRPTYAPFPYFLMDFPLTMTARVLYALLLNRAMLSQSNRWQDDEGRVYIFYLESEMAEDLHRGLTTVKKELSALEKVGLVQKVQQPHSSANRIYVKIIPDNNTSKKKKAVNPNIRDYSYDGEDSL